MSRVPVFSIVGRSNSGKTTLLERVIRGLRELDIRVATIKHDTHGFDIDHKGKDTYRHREAGAEVVLISSVERLAFMQELREELELVELVALVEERAKVDLILTEGYKTGSVPRLEVFNQGRYTELVSDLEATHLTAIVTDRPESIEIDKPVYHWDDVDGVVRHILEVTGLGG